MAVLDTNVILDLVGRSGKSKQRAARDALAERVRNGEPVFVTCFTHAELAVGVYRSADPAGERHKVDTALSHFPMLDFTADAIDQYGRLVARRQQAGEPMETIDAMLAAVAIAAGQTTLVTRNVRHFKQIAGLDVVGY